MNVTPQGEVYKNYDCPYDDVIACKPDYYTLYGKTAIVEKDGRSNKSAVLRENFPRLSSTVPRHITSTERIAAWCVIGPALTALCGLPVLLLAMAANSPMWRGW